MLLTLLFPHFFSLLCSLVLLTISIISVAPYIIIYSFLLPTLFTVLLTISIISVAPFIIIYSFLLPTLFICLLTVSILDLFLIYSESINTLYSFIHSYFYSTAKHKKLKIINHNVLCSLDPPNQGRLFWVNTEYYWLHRSNYVFG